MAGDTVITIIGNLTGDPELRFTPSGAAVANFTVASTPRQFDRQANEWKDGETLFMRCSIWREAAENVAESLTRGTRVVVQGRLVSRSWEDKETGQKRSVMEMQVDEIGPSLRYATAKVNKTQRSGGGGGSWGAASSLAVVRVAASVASPTTRGPLAATRAASAARVASSPVATRVVRVAGATLPATTSPPSDRSRALAPIPSSTTPSRGRSSGSPRTRRAPRWPSPLCVSPRRRPTR